MLLTAVGCVLLAFLPTAATTTANAVAPPAPPPTTPASAPSVQVDPLSGPPGATVTATATGYDGCPETGGDDVGPGPVEFLWDGGDQLDVVEVAVSSASTTFEVPESASLDGHLVVSRCAVDGSSLARTVFTVEPPVVVSVVVPSVVGMFLDEARATLSAVGLALGQVTGDGDEVGEQNPGAGTEVDPGTAVDVVMSVVTPVLVPVPDLIGLSLDEAGEELASGDLQLGSVSGDGDVVEGQSPLAGLQVPLGTTIDISLGLAQPELVLVPNLVGLDVEDVPGELAERGLELGQQSGDGDVVRGQRPGPGSLVPPGSAVNISVAPGVPPDPVVEVPDLTGMTVGEALDALVAAGLAMGSSPDMDGDVASQQPEPGTLVPVGSPVTLTLDGGVVGGSWLPVAAVALILAVGAALATHHSLRPRRDQRWLRRHVRLVPGASLPATFTTRELRTDSSPPTVVIGLEPRPDAGTYVLEEVPP